MPGPGKKPRSLKVVSGTTRADRDVPIVNLPIVDVLPSAPDWLPNAHAVNEWNRLGPILVANGLLTVGGLSAFGLLCGMHGKLVQLWAAGEAPTAAVVSQYRNLINDFGLTPVAQGRVKGATVEDEGNPFAANGARRAS